MFLWSDWQFSFPFYKSSACSGIVDKNSSNSPVVHVCPSEVSKVKKQEWIIRVRRKRWRKVGQEEAAWDGKNIDSVRASETDCKENDPALRWCLQSATEIAWIKIERGHSLNRGHSPLKLYSNLIRSPVAAILWDFQTTVRPECSTQPEKHTILLDLKNIHIHFEYFLYYLFVFSGLPGCTGLTRPCDSFLFFFP